MLINRMKFKCTWFSCLFERILPFQLNFTKVLNLANKQVQGFELQKKSSNVNKYQKSQQQRLFLFSVISYLYWEDLISALIFQLGYHQLLLYSIHEILLFSASN